MPEIENRKEQVPLRHYADLYARMDPGEAAERCGVAFDAARGRFTVRLLYVDYALSWPHFGIDCAGGNGFALASVPARILLMRYLLEGRRSTGTGRFLTYREMPWGEVYLKPFTGRCLTRAAYAFGPRLADFEAALDAMPAVRLDRGDAACQVELLPGYDMRLIVWAGDDEFPPNSQILFSDNFPLSFSAEDRTVAADILIGDLKRRMERV